MKKKISFLVDYYNRLLIVNTPIQYSQKTIGSKITCMYPILYRDCKVFVLSGFVLRIHKKHGHLNQMVKIKCNMNKMDFFIDLPVQMSILIDYHL